MGSATSMLRMKNQSVLTYFAQNVPPGKKMTIGNMASGLTLSLRDSFNREANEFAMRQRIQHMNAALAQGMRFGEATDGSFKTVLQQTTRENAGIQETTGGTVQKEADGTEATPRLQRNLEQAAGIIRQLNLRSEAWGVESLARDLAVFDLDFTALKDNPHEIADRIQKKTGELVAELDAKASDPSVDYEAKRREISGASARLVSGLRGAAGAVAVASVKLESTMAGSRTNVYVDGTVLDATAIVAAANVIVDPLVLDLNGDGIDLKGAEEGVDFDMNGDGTDSRMGFIRGDDALLFLDAYGDGVVRDGRQLFGNQNGYANGFEMLRQYDDNGDGVIDENDAIYDSLRLWVEKTEDGVCEADETMSLREAGVKAIHLGYEDVREDDGKGNLVGQKGSFTRDDGSTGQAADVWFQALAAQAPVRIE